MVLCILFAAVALAATDGGPRTVPASDAARREAVELLGRAIDGEPAIEAVQRAAEDRAAPRREDAEGWRARARLAGMLPRVVAEFRHDERTYRSVGVESGGEVDYVRSTPGDTVMLRLDWSLDGLVFGRHELAAAAAAEHAATQRHVAAEKATRLYYERLRLRVALAAAPATTGRARAEQELELAAVTAQLDALTGLYGESLR